MANKPTLEDLHDSLKIDPNNLDEDIMMQPQLFWTVSEQYVVAASRRDDAKENIAVTDAEINSDIRKEIEDEELKVTEKLVEARVLINPLHQNAVKKHREAKKEADLWMALKESFSDRSYMLREMGKLYSANYFSTDAIRSDVEYEHTKQGMSSKRGKRNIKQKRSKL